MVKHREITDDLVPFIAPVLQRSPLLKRLSESGIDKVAKSVSLVEYSEGETVVAEGAESDSFYMVFKGEVAIMTSNSDDACEICRFCPGKTFGEIGLLLQAPRTATVKALAGAQLLRFSAPVFDRLYHVVPGFGMAISRSLAARLRETSKLLEHPRFGAQGALPSAAVMGLVPLPFIERHRVLPMERIDNRLTVGFVDGPDSSVITALQTILPEMDIAAVKLHPSLFDRALRSAAGPKGSAADR